MADSGDGTPTWRQRRLGMELRRLREERNLGPHTAASLLGRTESSLSKLENAQRGIRKSALEQILDKYQVTDEPYRDALFTLARDAKKQGWWHAHEGKVSASMLDYIAIEAGATCIHSFQLHLVPGLLQTPRYARAVNTEDVSEVTPDVEGLVDIRMRRQRILVGDEAPQFRPIISEAALMQQMGGPGVMREQLAHILELMSQSNIVLQVLPFKAGAHASANGSFTMMESTGLWIVLVDTVTKGLYLEDPESLNIYHNVFNQLRASALSPSDSRSLIERIPSEYEQSDVLEPHLA